MNRTDDEMSEVYTQWQAALIIIICGLIIAGTIIGNVLVCTAVAIVRKLRTPSNLLIVSLAVSDLLVAVLVMPIATTNEIMAEWIYGRAVCEMWTSLDVMLCTASILNLCMISIDRYFVITRPFQYAIKRTPARMTVMIVVAWMLSALISIPPLFSGSWKAQLVAGRCVISEDLGYQSYATVGAFYLPLTVMIVIYYRIYMVSSRIAQAEAKSKPNGLDAGAAATTTATSPGVKLHCVTYTPKCSAGNESTSKDAFRDEFVATKTLVIVDNKHGPPSHKASQKSSSQPSSANGCSGASPDMADHQLAGGPPDSYKTSPVKGSGPGDKKKRTAIKLPKSVRLSALHSNECKATKTLGIIMGAFTACWLPFFILALVRSFCGGTQASPCIPHWLSSLFLWLGYANSFLNPVIYARFNREFRTPFRDILLLRCRGINLRLRTESYAEQFGATGGQSEWKPACRRRLVQLAGAAGGTGGGAGAAGEEAIDTVVQYHSGQGRTVIRLEERGDNGDVPQAVEDLKVTEGVPLHAGKEAVV